VTARAEVTLPGVDENHPAALAFHALNNAARLATFLPDEGIDDAGDRLVELLTDAGMHVADLYAEVTLRDGLITALEEDKRFLLDENLRLAGTLLRLEATDTRNKQDLIARDAIIAELRAGVTIEAPRMAAARS
jgi:hypothetical protein